MHLSVCMFLFIELLALLILLCCDCLERFGPDHVTSGDEERRGEEKEVDSDDDDHRKMGDTPTPTQTPVKTNTE